MERALASTRHEAPFGKLGQNRSGDVERLGALRRVGFYPLAGGRSPPVRLLPELHFARRLSRTGPRDVEPTRQAPGVALASPGESTHAHIGLCPPASADTIVFSRSFH